MPFNKAQLLWNVIIVSTNVLTPSDMYYHQRINATSKSSTTSCLRKSRFQFGVLATLSKVRRTIKERCPKNFQTPPQIEILIFGDSIAPRYPDTGPAYMPRKASFAFQRLSTDAGPCPNIFMTFTRHGQKTTVDFQVPTNVTKNPDANATY